MLLKHSAYYLLARGLPGVASFMSLVLYTRMLEPSVYGRYALVIAGIGFFDVVFFQWIRLSLLRFLPAHLENPSSFFATILSVFLGTAIITGGFGIGLALAWPDPGWQALIVIAIPLLWATAWVDLNLELARSSLQPAFYGLMTGARAVGALAIGLVLLLLGLKEQGPLLGLLAASLIVGTIWGRKTWLRRIARPSKRLFWQFFHYGFPLSATFALSFIISTSDRYMLAHFLNEATAGIYSASYDLAGQTLTLLMVTVNLAGYPLVVRALEEEGLGSARTQLRKNAILLLCISLPSAVGMVLLAPNIISIVLGAEFREAGMQLFPWVVISMFFAGIRAYYFDLGFQLGQKTIIQVWITGIAAAVNLCLNLILIPIYGALGAAYATCTAYTMALVLSIVMSRKVFAMPLPWGDGLKIVLATLAMGVVIWAAHDISGLVALVFQVILGAIIFGGLALFLDVGNYRNSILKGLAR